MFDLSSSQDFWAKAGVAKRKSGQRARVAASFFMETPDRVRQRVFLSSQNIGALRFIQAALLLATVHGSKHRL
jgi:hypothetical protein